MSNNEEFFVTLPSTGSIKEFTTNQANHFKVRLPQRLNLAGNHWKVALSSVSLPDATLTIENHLGLQPDTIVLRTTWAKQNVSSAMVEVARSIEMKDITTDTLLETGEQFMQSLMAMVQKTRMEDLGPGESLIYNGTKKRLVSDIRWERAGNDLELIIDYTGLHIQHVRYLPKLRLDINLAFKMGWLTHDATTDTYALGPNLIPEANRLSANLYMLDTLRDDGKPVLWKVVRNTYLALGPRCNWRFRNLNHAYRQIVGPTNRILYIYSDIAASSIVGGQITDLLREIQYTRRNRGTLYFEPIHLQYHAIRRNVIETIEVQISETHGKLVQFTSKQPSAITLVFKNEI